MLTLDTLKDFGANTAEGMGRCLNNEAFYFRLIGMALNDAGFDKLNQALSSGDLTAGFEAAHALKGVLGNLALTPLLTPASELCEQLRSGNAPDPKLLEELNAQRTRLRELCG